MILIAKIPSHDLKANAQIGVDGQLRKSNKMKSPFLHSSPPCPTPPRSSTGHGAAGSVSGGTCHRREVSRPPTAALTPKLPSPDAAVVATS